MSRNLSFVVAVAVVSLGGQEAYGQRYLVISGSSGGNVGSDYYIGLQAVGNPTITTLFGPAFLEVSQESTLLISRLMPETRYTERW